MHDMCTCALQIVYFLCCYQIESRKLQLFLATASIELVALDAAQARLAREGFRRFGKGRHPAGLNLGDCFSYALARALGEPLLYKGDDFLRTDVRPVYVPS